MVLQIAGTTDDAKSTVSLEDFKGLRVSHEPHPMAVEKVNISGGNIEERCTGLLKLLCEVCSKEDCKKCNNCL